MWLVQAWMSGKLIIFCACGVWYSYVEFMPQFLFTFSLLNIAVFLLCVAILQMSPWLINIKCFRCFFIVSICGKECVELISFVGCVKFFRTMTVVPLIVDIAAIFCIIACLHYYYGNWRKHHIIVTVATFLSWFLSSMIIFVLPIDVSSVCIPFFFSF